MPQFVDSSSSVGGRAFRSERARQSRHVASLGSDLQQRAESCQGMVRAIAWQIHRRLPSHIDVDDLIGYGQIGLAQAAHDYQSDKGARFETYAWYRIRGAILDGLSRMTWFRLADYHARRYEQHANELLELEAEDAADDGDARESAGRFGREIASLAVVYLASGFGSANDIADAGRREPDEDLMMEELRAKVRDLIKALPADAGALIHLVYFDGLSLQEAATELGKSKSWASRLHRRTIERLGRALRANAET